MSVLTAIDQIDRRLVYATTRLHSRRFFPVVRLLSRSGDGYVPVCCVLLALWVESPAATTLLHVGIIAFTFERLLYVCAKRFFKRRRPADTLIQFAAAVTPSDCFSFPSGHAMAAFLIATLLWFVMGLPAWLVFGWALGVACSRVLLGVHFPSDIVVGALLGVSIASLSLALVS